MGRVRSGRFSLLVMMILWVAAAFAQPQYEVVDLTELYGDRFTPTDINNHGVIGGNIGLNSKACIVQDGVLRLLPGYNGQPWYLTDLADNGDAHRGRSQLSRLFLPRRQSRGYRHLRREWRKRLRSSQGS